MSMGAIDNAGLRTTYSEYGIVTSPIDEQRLTVSLAYLCSHIDEDTYTVTIFFRPDPFSDPWFGILVPPPPWFQRIQVPRYGAILFQSFSHLRYLCVCELKTLSPLIREPNINF